jgi:hypothetical protein
MSTNGSISTPSIGTLRKTEEEKEKEKRLDLNSLNRNAGQENTDTSLFCGKNFVFGRPKCKVRICKQKVG